MAAAPSRSTSTRLTPATGNELVLTVWTGTRFSVWLPGASTARRPFSKARVLPVPRLRRFSEATSPRASFRLPVVRASWNCTSPACGIERNSSSPETAPVARISSSPITETGRASVVRAPSICEPTTTTASTTWASSVDAPAPTLWDWGRLAGAWRKVMVLPSSDWTIRPAALANLARASASATSPVTAGVCLPEAASNGNSTCFPDCLAKACSAVTASPAGMLKLWRASWARAGPARTSTAADAIRKPRTVRRRVSFDIFLGNPSGRHPSPWGRLRRIDAAGSRFRHWAVKLFAQLILVIPSAANRRAGPQGRPHSAGPWVPGRLCRPG